MPLTEKQFLWGLRYINFKRKTNLTRQELMEQQMYPVAGPELVDELTHYLQFASAVYFQSPEQVATALTECGCKFEVAGSPQHPNKQILSMVHGGTLIHESW